ncbi:MAG: guanitoxin biosynthesis heme-dependent pre-guanitoxin N-hydroxylase GntA [Sphingorhabdus sp.]
MLLYLDQSGHPLAQAFKAFVDEDSFPCVGAKSALGRNHLHFCVASDIRSNWDDMRVHHAISRFVRISSSEPDSLWSCVVIFEDASPLTEVQFERALWNRLQSWSDKDRWLGFEPDPAISTDSADPYFALSFAGEAFFAIGLHPHSSRLARSFERPAIVLNPHSQFRTLRETDRYERMREVILQRDALFSGSINPMVSRHGLESEARQYSGRATGRDWQCPFSRRTRWNADAA